MKGNAPATGQVACAGRHLPAVLLFVLTTLGVLAADLVSKSLAFQHVAGQPVHLNRESKAPQYQVPDHPAVPVVPGLPILSLKLTLNTGAVFGLGKGAQWFFVLVSILAIAVITRVFWRSDAEARVFQIALALMLAGALGNLYDRIRFNAVRDLLWLFPGVKLPFGWHWPGASNDLYPWIFNIADVALVFGVITLTVLMWRDGRREQTSPAAPG